MARFAADSVGFFSFRNRQSEYLHCTAFGRVCRSQPSGPREPLPGLTHARALHTIHRSHDSGMKTALKVLIWVCVSVLGAAALGTIAFERNEPLNAVWLVVAAVCTYAVAYRFYSAFIAAKVLALDGSRATPSERLEDGKDFVLLISGSCWGITSLRLPDQVHWSDPPWPH